MVIFIKRRSSGTGPPASPWPPESPPCPPGLLPVPLPPAPPFGVVESPLPPAAAGPSQKVAQAAGGGQRYRAPRPACSGCAAFAAGPSFGVGARSVAAFSRGAGHAATVSAIEIHA